MLTEMRHLLSHPSANPSTVAPTAPTARTATPTFEPTSWRHWAALSEQLAAAPVAAAALANATAALLARAADCTPSECSHAWRASSSSDADGFFAASARAQTLTSQTDWSRELKKVHATTPISAHDWQPVLARLEQFAIPAGRGAGPGRFAHADDALTRRKIF